MYEFLAFGRTP